MKKEIKINFNSFLEPIFKDGVYAHRFETKQYKKATHIWAFTSSGKIIIESIKDILKIINNQK